MKPTAAQKKWIAGVQKALNAPGSEGLGFYTIGDWDVSVYDLTREAELDQLSGDFCSRVDELDALIGQLDFPTAVHSTAG